MNLTPSSYENGPAPDLPSCVGLPVEAGVSTLEKSEHGQAPVVNDHVVAGNGVPSCAVRPLVISAV